MGRLEMSPEDLCEVYTLMELYEKTYGQAGITAAELKETVRKKCEERGVTGNIKKGLFRGSRAGGENSHPLRGMPLTGFSGNATMADLMEVERTVPGFFAIGYRIPGHCLGFLSGVASASVKNSCRNRFDGI